MSAHAYRPCREDGSIILALLAALVIGGIVITLMATTVMGQRQVRFDRNFANAIHAADSGVHAAVTAVNHAEVDPNNPLPVGAVIKVDQPNALTGAGDTDTQFWYTATKAAKTRWDVESWGEARDGTLRHVESTIEIPPIFEYAAFAKVNVGTSGDNCADSYNSDSPQSYPLGGTGKGVFGTNGKINIASSTASCTDGIELHDFYDDPNDPYDDDNDDIAKRVTTCNSGECNRFHVLKDQDPTGKVFGLFPKPLVIDDWWIERSLAPANAKDQRPDSSTNPTYGDPCQDEFGTAGVDPTILEFTKDNPPVKGKVYCSTAGLHFKANTNEKISLSGNSTDPTVIYTSGPVTVESQIDVNCDNCATPSAGTLPAGPDLQIYSIGSELTIKAHSRIGALLYAPRVKCAGGAGVHIWGAIVCQEMANQGTWNFHFDQSSRIPTAASFRITHWHEEQLGS